MDTLKTWKMEKESCSEKREFGNERSLDGKILKDLNNIKTVMMK